MATQTVQPGTIGYDGAGLKSKSDFTGWTNDWFSFYLGFNNGVGRSTIEAAWRAGKPVMLNCEGASDAGLGGAAKGKDYATRAIAWATGLGFGFTSAIVFSFVDFSPTASQYGVLDACHKAAVDTFAGKPIGFYLPKNYGDHLVQQSWFPQDAVMWHWAGDNAKPTPWTTVQQKYGQKVVGGVTVDENYVIQPVRMWSGDGMDPVTPEEEDMTDDEHQMVVDIHAALLAPQPVNDPYGQPLNMVWATLYAADMACRPQGLVSAIAAAVVAALPPASAGALTVQQITEACNVAIEAHSYVPVKH